MRCTIGLLALVIGCGASTSEPATPVVPAADSAAPAPDIGSPDTALPEVSEPPPDVPAPPQPKPVADAAAPVPLVISEWMAASTDPSKGDPIADLVEAGELTYPKEGIDQGLYWQAAIPGEGGQIHPPGIGLLIYAVARVTLPAATGALVRPDGIESIFVGGARQPGDPYQSGRHRVPIRLQVGENLIVVRAYRRGSDPSVAIETTPQEVAFNPADVTGPDLFVGSTAPQWVGLPLLNLTDAPASDVVARVLASDAFAPTELSMGSLAAGAATQIAFELVPKTLPADGDTVTARLHVESPSLAFAYELDVAIGRRAADATGAYRRTFRSDMDGSVQYMGVQPPTKVEPGKTYSLVLSLHGAGVEAIGQAGAYSAKDWAYVVAATNRRPFGFDWEAFGRLDAIEVLDTAMDVFPIDPTHVYLGGHSMGGHGTWQVGTLFPGRFAVIGPSAGWASFHTYGGTEWPKGAFGWAAMSADTPRWATNLVRRGVFIIHGDADDNVPVTEARVWKALLEPIVPDFHYHEEPGAGHWWDGDASAGADCVDWPPLFDLFQQRTLDPFELDFTFTTPSPGVSDRHSYVAIVSQNTPSEPSVLTSAREGPAVTLTTKNVRSMRLDGAALTARGITSLTIDGQGQAIAPEIDVGPKDGKHPGVMGPIAEVFHRPFCLVTADGAPPAYTRYAAWLVSEWTIIGNGRACALPLSQVTPELRKDKNLIYLGVPREALALPDTLPFSWDEAAVHVGGKDFPGAALAFVFPEGDRLSAAIVSARTFERLLFWLSPFSSRFWWPDYVVWSDEGGQSAGYFDATWNVP